MLDLSRTSVGTRTGMMGTKYVRSFTHERGNENRDDGYVRSFTHKRGNENRDDGYQVC